MAGQSALELEGPHLRGGLARDGDHGVKVLDLPDLSGMVRAACCEVLDVGRQQHPGYVLSVCFEVGYGHQLRLLAVLNEVPDVDAAL